MSTPHVQAYRFYGLGALLLYGLSLCLALVYAETSVLIAHLFASSMLGFTFCGYDKSVAGSRGLRAPEKFLWGVALIGGSPGLLLGMWLFRHKTRKASFQLGLLLILIVQLLLVRWSLAR